MGMGEDSSISLQELYRDGINIPCNPDDPVYLASEEGWESVKWEEIAVSEEIQDALATIASQFHYVHLAQLLLLGNVISGDSDLDAKRLALLLANTRMRDTDAWGRYLQRLGKVKEIDPVMENYFERLYNDAHTVSRLLGMVFGEVMITTIYRNMNGEDRTFERLLKRNMGQSERNINLAEHYLQRWITDHTIEKRREIANSVDRYIVLKERFLVSQRENLATVGIDADTVIEKFVRNADDFYNDIQPDDT